MTTSEPAGEPRPEDDTALLTAALNHSWTWYDEHMKRVFQLVNFYILATALLVTAYANSINGKHYGFATALAIVGLVLTAIASASALNQATAGGKAQDALHDMEDRIAGRLHADSDSHSQTPGWNTTHARCRGHHGRAGSRAVCRSADICGSPLNLQHAPSAAAPPDARPTSPRQPSQSGSTTPPIQAPNQARSWTSPTIPTANGQVAVAV